MRNLLLFGGIMSILDGIWTFFGGKTLIRSQGGWVQVSLSYSLTSMIVGIIFVLIANTYFKKK